MRPDASRPSRFSRLTTRGTTRRVPLAALALGAAFLTVGSGALGGGFTGPRQSLLSPAAPGAAAGDTQAVYGPKRFDTPTGSATYHVERFAVAVTPGQRYTLQVDNGGVTGGSVILNGSTVLSSSDLGSGAARWTRVVQALAEDTIQVTVQGPAGAAVTVSVLAASDPTFLVFGPERFIRSTGTPVTDTRHFAISATAAPRYYMCLVNGNADGTQRISSATIVLNGVTVLSPDELNQQVGGLVKPVTLQRDNTVDVTLTAKPNGFLDLCFRATDVTPPTITINQPPANFITREPQVTVAGTVQDETATTVAVNGQAAAMSGTSFTATVALTAEGNNVIHVVATDAAGNSTDSTRTVIHDTQPPVLTLTSPGDGLITKATSVPVSGTVTDLTAVTVNVNGIPLPVDPTGAFSGSVSLTEGSNVLTVTATDAAGNATTQVRTIMLDTHPPVLAVTAPANGLITNQTSTTVSGSVTDATAVTVATNGAPLPVGADGQFSGSVALTEGSNTLTTVATDAAGNATTDTRTVTLDTHPPVLVVTAPPDGLITRQTPVTVSGTVTDATPVTVDVNGIPLPVDGAGVFTGLVPLAEGANPLTVTARDAASNTATLVRIVTLDTQAPVIAVAQPADGTILNAASVTTTGTVTDATATTLTVNGNPVALGAGGAFSAEVPLAPGANSIAYAATDAAGNSATATITVTRKTSNLPPDPALVANVVNRAEVTTIGANTAFLYSGTTPIQTGVAASTINPVRAAVVRGRVLDKTFAPLGGSTVTILNHPELGQTVSREDGGYDLAVNGGGPLTVSFVKDGYFPAQRAADVSWQDYTTLDDVILLQPDPAVTVVDLTSPTPPVARGSVVSDADGPRQATLIFKPGNTATLTLPDGSTQSLTSLSVRATEYTVGDSGNLSMPAQLPPASQYTYAVQISADEQLAAGPGAQVTVSQPVPFYVENFLHVPVGTAVPVGGYDATAGTWMPQPNGIALKVLGKDATGRALVDITGDGQADPPSALAALGIDDYELLQLGGTYPAGSDLWRALVPRIEPLDLNFPFIFVGTTPTDGKVKAGCSSREGDPLRCQLQAQTAFQRVGIVGSPFTLNYASDRTQGNAADRKLDITLTGPTLQPQLLRVELEVDVAGKRFRGSFDPQPNLTYTLTWDGKDIYGRLVQGTQAATVLIGYVFPVQYAAPANAIDAFGQPCAPSGTGSVCPIIASAQTGARAERTLVERLETSTGTLDATALGLGGFTLDVQHVYDPVGQMLYRGDGTRRAAAALPPGIQTVVGGCVSSCTFTGGPALRAQIGQIGGMTFAADGTMYFSDIASGRVQRVTPDGNFTTVAGAGPAAPYGDGGPATQANIGAPYGLALGPDGSLYIADGSGQSVVRRVLPNGIITTFAGIRNSFGYNGDNIPATSAQLTVAAGLALGPDGSLYIADGRRVRRVGPDGIITTVAGTGDICDIRFLAGCGDGGLATRAPLGIVADVKFGPDRSLYAVMGFPEYRVRRIGPDGIIRAVAGSSVGSIFGDIDSGDGGPATLAAIGTPSTLAFGPDGSMYLGEGSSADANIHKVRRVTPNGIITTFAGTGVYGFSGDGGPAAAATLKRTFDAIGVGPDGNLYSGEIGRIRKVSGFLPGFGAGQTVVASTDGSELYVFSSAGRHTLTLDAATSDTVYRFSYDQNRRLIEVTDRSGRVTQLQRNDAGIVTAVVTPDGGQTGFTLDDSGNPTGITDQAGRQTQFGYTGGGLLTGVTDPNHNSLQYGYDGDGLVQQRSDAGGGTIAWARSGSSLSLSTSLSRTTAFDVVPLATGGSQQVSTIPGGFTFQSSVDAAGKAVTRAPDGTVATITKRGDPRFGNQAPLVEQVITTPSGLTRTQRTSRAITLSDSTNPLSVVTQTDSFIVNDRVRTEVRTKATKRVTDTEPSGRQALVQLDGAGRVLTVSVSGFETRSNSYDGAGRLTGIAQGSRSIAYAYDAAGFLTSSTDPFGRTTTYDHDAAGRVTAETRADGRTIRYAYDANGNLLSVTPPNRSAHLFSYTSTDRMETYTPPDVGLPGSTTLSYNADGQVVRVSRPSGDSITFAYDSAGRRAMVTTPQGTTTYRYDAASGRLVEVQAPGGTVAYAYDGALITRLSWSGQVAGSLSTTYDNEFRVSTQSVNGQFAVSNTYDPDGLLTSVGALSISRATTTGLVTGTAIGSLTTSRTNNGYGEMSAFSASVGSEPLYQASYTRDLTGRIATISEALEGRSTAYGFVFDTAGRLVNITKDGGPYAAYEYDPNGNRTRATTAAGTLLGTYDVQDRLMSYGDATFAYTLNGELETKTLGSQTTTYRYDTFGNLLRATLPDGTRIDYLVDGANRRIGKLVNGVYSQGFLYAGPLHPVAELDGTNAVVSRFVYGTRTEVPEYMIKGGRTYRIIGDHLGSVRLVVDVATGDIAQRIDYDYFGRMVMNTNSGFQPFGFAGGLYDQHTGLTHFGRREYDPETGRFTSRDPILFGGADPNLYEYAQGDPVNGLDPQGTFSLVEMETAEDVNTTLEAIASSPWLVGAIQGCVVGGLGDAMGDLFSTGDWSIGHVAKGCLIGGAFGAATSGTLAALEGTYATASLGARMTLSCMFGGTAGMITGAAGEMLDGDGEGHVAPIVLGLGMGCLAGATGQGLQLSKLAKNRLYGGVAAAILDIYFDINQRSFELYYEN